MQICEEEKCVGCSACRNVCPTAAITMIYNLEGFLVPQINKSACIGCEECRSVCPVMGRHTTETPKSTFYVVRAKRDICEMSSSGGVFFALAEYVICKLKGYVCGAVWDDSLGVKHRITKNIEEVKEMCQSKYVESDLGDVYFRIRKLLNEGQTVLFSGTPCQNAGLKAFLGQDYDLLLMVDVLCRGIPSQKVFREYLNDNFKGRRVKKVSFRDKSFYRWGIGIHVWLDDGTVYRKPFPDDPYLKLLEGGYSFRKSCGRNCTFNSERRITDITLGDFWAIGLWDIRHKDDCKEGIFDYSGTSIVSINSVKGERIIEACKTVFDLMEEIKMGEAIFGNNFLTPQLYDIDARNRFFGLLDKKGFEKAAWYVNGNKYDIAILGLWNGNNYGAMVTAKALYDFLVRLGYEVVLVDTQFTYGTRNHKIQEYITDDCNISVVYEAKEDMYSLNERCDTFLVGSDQCWNPLLNHMYKDIFLLDFVNSEKRKLSYSTSFGHGYIDWSEGDREDYAFYLGKFDGISVREEAGGIICKDLGINNAKHVIDPIFFLDKEQVKHTESIDYGYTLNYILDVTKDTDWILKSVNGKIGNSVRCILGLDYSNLWDLKLENLISINNVSEFLSAFLNSGYIVTDSYHGMCLAILFNKPFSVIINEGRGKPRFDSLLKKLCLEGRGISCGDTDFDISEIDYELVNGLVEEFKSESIEWLVRALEAPKVIKKDGYLYNKIRKLENQLFNINKRQILANEAVRNPVIQRIILYFEQKLKTNMIVAIRGGGYHTEALLELIYPIIEKKAICYQVLDKTRKILQVGERRITVSEVSEEYILKSDAVIISSWRYHDEVMKEISGILEKEKYGKPEVLDIYTALQLNENYPFYDIRTNFRGEG